MTTSQISYRSITMLEIMMPLPMAYNDTGKKIFMQTPCHKEVQSWIFNLRVQIFFIKIDHSFAEFQYSVKPSSDIKHYCIGYIFCYSAFIFCYRLWWKKCEPRARKHSPWNRM